MKLLSALTLLLSVSIVGASEPKKDPTERDLERIQGKWEVVAVKRDGKHQHGEVGQKVGDVITIGLDQGKLGLG